MTQASFVIVSELIVKRLKPHAEGEFVERLAAAVELHMPEKIELFQSVSLSQSPSQTDMAQDTEKSLKDSVRDSQSYFSKLTLAKTQLCSRLTDPNLENQLRVTTSSLTPDIRCLTKEKQFQPSH